MELCTVHGLNDNIQKVENVSKVGTVVHALFNQEPRKFKKRQSKSGTGVERTLMAEKVDSLLANYKRCDFCFSVHMYDFCLTKKWLASHNIAARIPLLVKDLIAFRMKTPHMTIDEAE